MSTHPAVPTGTQSERLEEAVTVTDVLVVATMMSTASTSIPVKKEKKGINCYSSKHSVKRSMDR